MVLTWSVVAAAPQNMVSTQFLRLHQRGRQWAPKTKSRAMRSAVPATTVTLKLHEFGTKRVLEFVGSFKGNYWTTRK